MGLTLEQQARREKRWAKRAPFYAAQEAAHVAFELSIGEPVSAHRRMTYETWRADPGRLIKTFERKCRQLMDAHDASRLVASYKMRMAAIGAVEKALKSPAMNRMGELRQP